MFECPCCHEETELELDSLDTGFAAYGTCDHCDATINLTLNHNKKVVGTLSKCPSPIETVEVTLDQDVPEYMEGILRIGTVQIVFEDGTREDHDELVDNSEFRSEEAIRKFVSKKLQVNIDLVEIIPVYED